MKTKQDVLAILLAASTSVAAVAGNLTGAQTASVRSTIQAVPLAEVATTATALVSAADRKLRADFAVEAVRAAAQRNPSTVVAVVASIAKAFPDVAAAAAAEAVTLLPDQAESIAFAATSAAPESAGKILAAMSDAAPKSQAIIARAISSASANAAPASRTRINARGEAGHNGETYTRSSNQLNGQPFPSNPPQNVSSYGSPGSDPSRP